MDVLSHLIDLVLLQTVVVSATATTAATATAAPIEKLHFLSAQVVQ